MLSDLELKLELLRLAHGDIDRAQTMYEWMYPPAALRTPEVETDTVQDRVEPLLDPQSPSITSEVRTQAEDVAAIEALANDETFIEAMSELLDEAQPDPADLPPPTEAEFNALEKLDGGDPFESGEETLDALKEETARGGAPHCVVCGLTVTPENVSYRGEDGWYCLGDHGPSVLHAYNAGANLRKAGGPRPLDGHYPDDENMTRAAQTGWDEEVEPAPMVSEPQTPAEGTGDRVEQENNLAQVLGAGISREAAEKEKPRHRFSIFGLKENA